MGWTKKEYCHTTNDLTYASDVDDASVVEQQPIRKGSKKLAVPLVADSQLNSDCISTKTKSVFSLRRPLLGSRGRRRSDVLSRVESDVQDNEKDISPRSSSLTLCSSSDSIKVGSKISKYDNSSLIRNYTQRYGALRGRAVVLSNRSKVHLEQGDDTTMGCTCYFNINHLQVFVEHEANTNQFHLLCNVIDVPSLENDNERIESDIPNSVLERVKELHETLTDTTNASTTLKVSMDRSEIILDHVSTSSRKTGTIKKSKTKSSSRKFQFDEFCFLLDQFIMTAVLLNQNLALFWNKSPQVVAK